MSQRISEAEMATAVESILKKRPKNSATFAELRELVPKHVHLSRADCAESPSRPGEQLWEQIIRNLASHEHEGFVRVAGGLRLQWRGKAKSAEKTVGAHAA